MSELRDWVRDMAGRDPRRHDPDPVIRSLSNACMALSWAGAAMLVVAVVAVIHAIKVIL